MDKKKRARSRPKTLGAAGAMTVLLRDAIKPNLLQTLEHGPVFVHTGPFGNIAHGNSSVLADQIGLKLADFVVTESGFGSDLGFEKMVDIKCRNSGLRPDAAVIVATVRALKAHSGKYRIVAGRPLPASLGDEDLEAVEQGMGNLEKHIENVTKHGGLPAVVCINRFSYDSDAEIELVRKRALAAGAMACEVSEVWEHGGAGGEALAPRRRRRGRAAEHLRLPLQGRRDRPARRSTPSRRSMYGADGVDYLPGGAPPDRPVHGLGPGQPAGLHRQDATSRSPPTPTSAAARPASASTCARYGPPPAPASSSPTWARSARCPACPASPPQPRRHGRQRQRHGAWF